MKQPTPRTIKDDQGNRYLIVYPPKLRPLHIQFEKLRHTICGRDASRWGIVRSTRRIGVDNFCTKCQETRTFRRLKLETLLIV